MNTNEQRKLPVIRQSYAATYLKPNVENREIRKKVNGQLRRCLTSNYGALEMKVKYRALQQIQHLFVGVKVGEEIPLDINNLSDEDLTVKIDASILVSKEHYKEVDLAALNLTRLGFSYSDNEYAFRAINVLSEASRKRNSNILVVKFTKPFIECLSTTKGWASFYDVDIICSLSSVNSMRFYEIISRQGRDGRPLILSFVELKEILGMKDQYEGAQGPKNFENWVLKRVKKELDEKCPYSFDFKKTKSEDKGLCYVFRIYHLPKNEPQDTYSKELAKRISLGIDKETRDFLRMQSTYAFTNEEIKNNNDVFLSFERQTGLNLLSFLIERCPEAKTKDNPKGWLIGVMKSVMKNGS